MYAGYQRSPFSDTVLLLSKERTGPYFSSGTSPKLKSLRITFKSLINYLCHFYIRNCIYYY